MNKLMYLFNFEFERNFSDYRGLIIASNFLFIWNLIGNLNEYNDIIIKGSEHQSLTSWIGASSFSNIISLDGGLGSSFLVGILLCVWCSVLIWRNDFSKNNKSIYTLAMLPQDRMVIYLSKFLNILSLIYIYTISFIVVLYLSYLIVPKFIEGEVIKHGFIQDTIYQFGMYIPYNIELFIVVYIFGISAVICSVFTFMIFTQGRIGTFIILCLILIGITAFNIIASFIDVNIIDYIVANFGYRNLNMILCIMFSVIIAINLIISKRKLSKIDF